MKQTLKGLERTWNPRGNSEGKDENEIVQIVLYKLNSLYGEDAIIRSLLNFIRKYKKEVFLYLDNPDVEKTSDKAEQDFSIQSWIFKHRFKTKRVV